VLDILIVDDHLLVRAGLECMLNGTEGMRVVGTAADGLEALRLARRLAPDVVLMDLCMPGIDGVEATRLLRASQCAPVVVVLTSACAPAVVRDAFAAGAAGYLLKDMPPEQLLEALRGLASGRPAIDPRVARILGRQHGPATPGPAGTQPQPVDRGPHSPAA
jgi:DNA-binding NarL/FixJ family response regulator